METNINALIEKYGPDATLKEIKKDINENLYSDRTGKKLIAHYLGFDAEYGEIGEYAFTFKDTILNVGDLVNIAFKIASGPPEKSYLVIKDNEDAFFMFLKNYDKSLIESVQVIKKYDTLTQEDLINNDYNFFEIVNLK